MKRLFFFYILVSVMAIALFGFIGLLDHHSAFANCASALTNTKMPPCNSEGSLAVGISQAQIYQTFSLTVLVLSALTLVIVLGLLELFFEIDRTAFYQKITKYLDDFSSASEQKIIKWFNILQHSDPRLNI